MSWFGDLADEAASLDTSGAGATTELMDKLSHYVPDSFSLQDLAAAARESFGGALSAKPRAVRKQLVALLVCLRCENRIVHAGPADQDAVKELAQNIAKSFAPVMTVDESLKQGNDPSEVPSTELSRNRAALVTQCQTTSDIGLEALDALVKQAGPVRLDDEVLHALLVFTDESKPWGGPRSRAIATKLLEDQFSIPGSPTKEQFLTESVLQRYLRPLFSKSKPSSVTASGRKAEYPDGAATRAESILDESALTKPWKYTDLRAVPAMGWAVREADNQLVAKQWPLFIPVLLTLVDDSSTHVDGLLLLDQFLAKFPDKTLHDTGLAQVFEDAVFPILSFLPSLTPEAESVELLGPAYAALLSLANKQPAVGKDGIPASPKNRLLDKILREGVFMGYFHAKEHVRIVAVLCRQTATILDDMGVHAVKHLKDLIPMLSAIMTDPFAPLAPDTLLSAIKALQAVLANCWPRIPGSPWQDEIINALVFCWLNLAEHDHPAASDQAYSRLGQELLTSSKALTAVLKSAESEDSGAATDLATHVAPLVAKDARLAALFPSS